MGFYWVSLDEDLFVVGILEGRLGQDELIEDFGGRKNVIKLNLLNLLLSRKSLFRYFFGGRLY